jgi:hypothetical protein
MINSEKANFRCHTKCCRACRYYRTYKTQAIVSECLLLGRTLGISNKGSDLSQWDRQRICDFWLKRPKSWLFVADKNPHWHDKYITRKSLIKIKKRRGLK